MVEAPKPKNIPVLVVFYTLKKDRSLKSIPRHLAEFYYNRSLRRPHTRTCIIMEEQTGFFVHLLFFIKEKHIN